MFIFCTDLYSGFESLCHIHRSVLNIDKIVLLLKIMKFFQIQDSGGGGHRGAARGGRQNGIQEIYSYGLIAFFLGTYIRW